MFEDCSKYKKSAIFVAIIMASFALYAKLVQNGIAQKADDLLVLIMFFILVPILIIFGLPYLNCLNKHKKYK